MGISGVPLEETTSRKEISDALIKHQGMVSYAAKEIGCHHGTLLRYLENNPEMAAIREEARKGYIEKRLDVCESVLDILASKVNTDPSNAYKSSVYILNNLGKKRGYAHPKAQEVNQDYDELVDKSEGLINNKTESQGS